jgi:hypothetical protein
MTIIGQSGVLFLNNTKDVPFRTQTTEQEFDWSS